MIPSLFPDRILFPNQVLRFKPLFKAPWLSANLAQALKLVKQKFHPHFIFYIFLLSSTSRTCSPVRIVSRKLTNKWFDVSSTSPREAGKNGIHSTNAENNAKFKPIRQIWPEPARATNYLPVANCNIEFSEACSEKGFSMMYRKWLRIDSRGKVS
jgi:hypothetical protein